MPRISFLPHSNVDYMVPGTGRIFNHRGKPHSVETGPLHKPGLPFWDLLHMDMLVSFPVLWTLITEGLPGACSLKEHPLVLFRPSH